MSAAPPPTELMKPGSSPASSAGLSSPPSPRSPTAHATVAYPQLPHQYPNNGANGVAGDKAAAAAKSTAPKQRKPRKKKEVGDEIDGNISVTPVNGDKAPPKVRKPRAPKGSSTAAASKRENKLAFPTAPNLAKAPAIAPTPITDHQGSPHSLQHSGVPAASPHLPIGKVDEAIPRQPSTSFGNTKFPPPRPASGQVYDPVRSTMHENMIEDRRKYFEEHQSYVQRRLDEDKRQRDAQNAVGASLSLSIASLLKSDSTALEKKLNPKRENELPPTALPEAKRPCLTAPPNALEPTHPAPKEPQVAMSPNHFARDRPSSAKAPSPVEVDTDKDKVPNKPMSKQPAGTKKPSGQSSSSHSPKPGARKDASLPPLPPGNGLLSSAMLGGGYDSKGPERTAPTVVLHVSLKGETNKYVNFARLAEEQYGFDALHPRLAAQRERLARVAAAGAALEHAHKNGSGRSGDEMSVDLSDGEPEADNSNVEMGGLDGATKEVKQSEADGSEQQPGVKRRKKRTMKEDMYDKDDPFVDDAELAFVEQAAVTKDGFFVYSGPLMTEGEKPTIERSNGAPRGRGGRGRGRGSAVSGRRTHPPPEHNNSEHVAVALARPKAEAEAAEPSGGAKLTKSGQPRKARVTKAVKLEMEKEKAERERSIQSTITNRMSAQIPSGAPILAKPTSYPG
ncbi:MAG: hypothetical protein Q9219_004267 [cf. Caloplaca sp. 3 TL-2023]